MIEDYLDKDYKEIAENLSRWIKNKVKESGSDGAVVGLSGGIDSSLTSLLCKKAFPDNTLGLILPCQSNEQDQIDAIAHAEKFEIDYKIIDLKNTYQEFVKSLNLDNLDRFSTSIKNINGDQKLKLALANVKPRLRMAYLYFYANLNNYLVVGTDNRSELKLGYFTKFGDGGIDLAPLANLTKTEVRKTAAELNIADKIINKAPSAGLWEEQKDETELGMSYEEIDKYILTGEAKEETKTKIENLAKKNSHKLELPEMPDF
ncbi:NAD(+) synthase [Halanaerobium hydrogeniformans]|uniref:NH(3)-dependent NAD(+) synthetase n=1 Tax=Halanaerobium hydrogeniformans TaxID=656519 RepID=E4RMP6_HALHG|nr:NAD(+) synthase [Halanaerobium hydrogeniformans]ADQ14577.1 NAD+ synthetase [Halanaerobium hydrogeniformans]